jgi:phage regulator Rha-like protein
LADFEEFGLVRFEIAPRPVGQHGGGDVTVAILNEDQATLAMTYLRNNDVVRDFKKRLVREFSALRRMVASQTREERLALAVLDAQQMITERDEQLAIVTTEKKCLEAAIERDAPLVAKAEAHTANAKSINRQSFAREVQQWGVKQGINILQDQVYELLRRKGMLIDGHRADRNHATSHAVKSGWAFTHKDITEDGYPTAVTMLNPRGQDVAWKWITAYVSQNGNLILPPKITGGAA